MIPFDQAFIKRCRKGDPVAQKHLFEKLYAPMYRLCFRYVGQQAEAEDCLMKGFMKSFQRFDSFEYMNEQSLFVWIRKVMVNECLMELRKMSTLSLIPQEVLPESPAYDYTLENMAAEEIYKLVVELPAGYRTVFNLAIIEGHSHQEIAAMLNITESTSRSQLVKARNLLRSKIENTRTYEAKHG
jgi:RNA polymerase sigma-70 factor (ECF subfamily)